MLSSLLIANRGEIARRIIRTARRMGIRTIAVFTEADRSWPHWREADQAILIGDGPAAESYLSIERIVGAAVESGAEAVHPGYGFLSENAAFVEACAAAGLVFVGPPASAMRAMGFKSEAKIIMARAGVPVVPGYNGERQDPDFLKQKAYEIGYPVLVKAVAGGGGRGMRRIDRAPDFEAGLGAAKREALAGFGNDRVLVERYLNTPRHIEVQVFGDGHGNFVHLFERDCSVQRRHQKVIEEALAPGLADDVRDYLGAAAVKAAAAVGYQGAGTVEFIADASSELRRDSFFFMEMNTRLQVEHPVTEAVTGLDLVEWQIRVAAGEELPLRQDEIALRGHAFEARLYAEDPAQGFQPSTGRLWAAAFPDGAGIRIDAGVEEGSVVGPFYDSMLAKVIASGADRDEALRRLQAALQGVRVAGPKTNLAFLSAIVAHPEFVAGAPDTGFIDRELDRLGAPPAELSDAAPAIVEWVSRKAKELAAGAPGPWSRADAFEVGGLQRRAGMEVVIEGSSMRADISWGEDGPRILSLDGSELRQLPAFEIVWAVDQAFVLQGGNQLRVGFPDPLARDLDAVQAGGQVSAPMHGRVVSVHVSEGDRVAKGDLLFTVEAMKVEHSVLAPVGGVIAAVAVAAGEQIEQGAPAMTIDPDGEAAPVAGVAE
jgi:3-methylcrotonyl-CoA carboxylase alpha subunit